MKQHRDSEDEQHIMDWYVTDPHDTPALNEVLDRKEFLALAETNDDLCAVEQLLAITHHDGLE